jgi:hypothetical protein
MPVGGEQCGVIFQKQKRNAAKMLIIDNVAKTLYPRVTKGIKILQKYYSFIMVVVLPQYGIRF